MAFLPVEHIVRMPDETDAKKILTAPLLGELDETTV